MGNPEYESFLESKRITAPSSGFSIAIKGLNPRLFDWQKPVVRWALGKGKAALFEGCGLGKTIQQLEWSRHVHQNTQGNVLILAPLAVVEQTHGEGQHFDIKTTICRTQSDVRDGINITNYDMLEHFDTSSFAGIVLDESSILKSVNGPTRQQITEGFRATPYRLACSATPAPNDHMELGTHAEFLGVMTRAEMLATFFVHDGGDTSQWRLKGHAQSAFWKWVCSWAVMIRTPSDIGFSDEGYVLPKFHRHVHVVALDTPIEGYLFTPDKLTLTERRSVRRTSLDSRVAKCAEIVNQTTDQWIIWCDLNDESTALAKAINGAVEVTGSDSNEFKRQTALDFISGKVHRVVTKGSMFGWGVNWQHCHNAAHVGLSDSFEGLYQKDRRCLRFGQEHEVHSHIIISDGDGPVAKNVERKEHEFQQMADGMIEHMKDEMQKELTGTVRDENAYKIDMKSGKQWELYLGDCVDVIKDFPSESVHYSISSLPFASLYTYSASGRDMGNCRTYEEFSAHFAFLCVELIRVMMSGRLVSFHCMNLPTSKEKDGYIGIRDFRGDIIRAMQKVGFIYHSEVCIWKDPVTAMQRTKAIGLLYKQLRKDSCMSRQGIPDYLVTFRKPGDNVERVTKVAPPGGSTYKHARNVPVNEFPVDLWQQYASPVWMDINPSDTLTKESAREHADERHIAPLQVEVVERAIRLWSNEDDIVLSPFAGIGTEGYQAVKMGRRFKGVELKESYWNQACINLATVESSGKEQRSIFDDLEDLDEEIEAAV